MRMRCIALLGAVIVLGPSGVNAATLADAKSLYAEASFEEALAALAQVDESSGVTVEVLQYRALCLLALGRVSEAARVTESLVYAAPSFAPPPAEVSPRFLTLLAAARRALLPAIAKKQFENGREQFHAKAQDAAMTSFQQVLTLTADPTWADTSEASDLRTLASGFIELAAAAKPAAPAAVASAPAAGAATPAPAAATPVPRNKGVELPVAINQAMPTWTPPDLQTAHREYIGSVRVVITPAGTVSRARMERPIHPSFDTVLLRAAQGWLYKPAMINGTPVEFEKVIEVVLRAR